MQTYFELSRIGRRKGREQFDLGLQGPISRPCEAVLLCAFGLAKECLEGSQYSRHEAQ